MIFYKLDKNKKPISCGIVEWSEQLDSFDSSRITKKSTVKNVDVSTVFLGNDHRFTGKGKPILWETMVFSDEDCFDGYMIRATSHKQALKNHYRVVRAFRDDHIKTLLNWS